MTKIKVLSVEDSLLIQALLEQLLTADPDIEFLGVAADPYVAREMIKANEPDVITLDINMPRMNGIDFLKNLMRLHPLPVVIVSHITRDILASVIDSYPAGAVDYINKPTFEQLNDFDNYAKFFNERVKQTARINRDALRIMQPIETTVTTPMVKPSTGYGTNKFISAKAMQETIVVMGASTGGIDAIEKILLGLPREFPGILIVQHMRYGFTEVLANRLNQIVNFEVVEAKPNMPIIPGRIIIATAGSNLTVHVQSGLGYICHLEGSNADIPHHTDTLLRQQEVIDEELNIEEGARPSVNALFFSAAAAADLGCRVVGVLLTGMGEDGAQGLKAIQMAGGTTIVQDEETSVVWGMPGEAVKLNAADYVLPLPEISHKLINLLQKTK